jgi:hypothetical protein
MSLSCSGGSDGQAGLGEAALWASGLLVAVALLIALPLLTAITAGRTTKVLQ